MVTINMISEKTSVEIDSFITLLKGHIEQSEEFSPGGIIYAEFNKYLIGVDGISEIDQLRGDEPYKKSWTPQRREIKAVLVFNRNFKGQFLSILMVKMLPIVEKTYHLLSVKNKLSGYSKKHGEQ